MLKLLTLYFILYLLRQTVKLHDIGHGFWGKCRMGRTMPSFLASISFFPSVHGGYYPLCLHHLFFLVIFFLYLPVVAVWVISLFFLVVFKIFSLSLMFCKFVIYCLVCLIVLALDTFVCLRWDVCYQTRFE